MVHVSHMGISIEPGDHTAAGSPMSAATVSPSPEQVAEVARLPYWLLDCGLRRNDGLGGKVR